MMQQYLLNAKAANPVLLVNHALKINPNCNVLYELKNALNFCLDGRTSLVSREHSLNTRKRIV